MLPIARYHDAAAPMVLTPGGIIAAGAFFDATRALAAALPPGTRVVNLCDGRLAFMLAFAASLAAGKVSLLPSGQGRDDFAQAVGGGDLPAVLADSGEAGTFDVRPFLPRPGMAGDRLDVPAVAADAVAAILFTSGSTGRPTAHPKRWGQLMQGAGSLGAALGWQDMQGDGRDTAIVGSVPPQHMFGLETTVLLPWCHGLPVHAAKPLLPADVAVAIAGCGRPAWWMATPLHLRAPLAGRDALPGLAGVVASTMSLPQPLAAAAEAAWQVPVHEVYGSTETGALAVRRTAVESRWQPLAGIAFEGRARDGEDGGDGEGDEVRVFARGGHVGEPVPLGDRLAFEPDGRFRWLGRHADLVKLGGKRASLAALNQLIQGIEGVDDAAYHLPGGEDAGRHDEAHPAHRLAAFYVSATLSPDALMARLREHLDPVFLPRPLVRVASLPRNATGKLPQAALMALMALHARSRAPVIAVDAAHPALPGHFPGRPLVPGAMMVALVARALARELGDDGARELGAMRFMAPWVPGVPCRVLPEAVPGRLKFEVRRADDDTLLASGHWVLAGSGSAA